MAGFVVLAVGCADGFTLEPTVILDGSFTAIEQAAELRGIESWTDVVPAFRPRYEGTWTHEQLMAFAREAHLAPNVVYVLRLSAHEDCPHHGDISDYLGYEERRDGGRLLCIQSALIDADEPEPGGTTLRIDNAAHEMGHALGLGHGLHGTVMFHRPELDVTALPTCVDGRRVAMRWSTPVSDRCLSSPGQP